MVAGRQFLFHLGLLVLRRLIRARCFVWSFSLFVCWLRSSICLLKRGFGFHFNKFVHVVSHAQLILRKLLRVTNLLDWRSVWLSIQTAIWQVVSLLGLHALLRQWMQFPAFFARKVGVKRHLLFAAVWSSFFHRWLWFNFNWVSFKRLLILLLVIGGLPSH